MGKKKQNKGKARKDSSDIEKPQPYLYHELLQSEGLNPPKVQNEKIIEEILEKMK